MKLATFQPKVLPLIYSKFTHLLAADDQLSYWHINSLFWLKSGHVYCTTSSYSQTGFNKDPCLLPRQ